MSEEARTQLLEWLDGRLPPDGVAWLRARCGDVAAGAPARKLFLSFSAMPRHTGKAPLDWAANDLARAGQVRAGWDPSDWTADQAGRIALVLHVPQDVHGTMEKLFGTADFGEAVALFKALPLLPDPAAYKTRCTEGIRTNITDVFLAVAHRNPYPREQLDEAAWNQMVLKALFVGVALDPICGLDELANPRLMRMLCDYAHERWAAHRTVSPELWRCVGPHADDDARADLQRVLDGDDVASRRAAALALRAAGVAVDFELPDGFGWSDLA